MRNNADAITCNLNYERMSERKTGRLMQTVQSDTGGQYLSDEMEEQFCTSDIERLLTIAYSSLQNGVAEQMSRALLHWVRLMV